MMERLVEDSAIAQRTSEILIETGSYLIHFDKPRINGLSYQMVV